jgi:DNA replication and repair protein RecF
MALRRLQVTDFRCLPSAELEIDPRYTLISGGNATGKTTLLESIYLLGRGRSFRTRRIERLVRRGGERFVVFGEVQCADRRVAVGIEGGSGGIRARIGGEPVGTLAELALTLPVQIIDPEIHQLIEDGPGRRRRFIDWGVFHVEPDFLGHWQRFHLALRQRNAALKGRQPKSLVSIWDADLIRHGNSVGMARERYVARLAVEVANLGQRLLGHAPALAYRSGWSRDLDLGAALQASWPLDQERGVTQAGPHRAELALSMGGAAVREHVSRGQQKLLAATLLLAQLRLFPPSATVKPTLLLDDPAAELDDQRLMGLIQEVTQLDIQLVATTLQAQLPGLGLPGRRYELSGTTVVAA